MAFPLKILVAPDKFKGSLSATAVASAISQGIRREWPDAIITAKPIADGGEGFCEALSRRITSVRVFDALGREVVADYGWLDDYTAVIEMSAASGLWRITPTERDPLRSSTFGTGEMIRDALDRGARDILVGLGGSATNDGGAGMAAALGYQFLDSAGEPIEPIPANLCRLAAIKRPSRHSFPRIIAACDVNNPLLGERGATRIYGPQKGASEAELETLERALEHLADIVARDLDCDFRDIPGAGAAGGMGFGLMSFCGAEIRSGFDLIAEFVKLEEAVMASDFVITGEGKIDSQTLQGKGPAGVAALARKHGKPAIAFAGVHESADAGTTAAIFDAVFAISHPGFPIGYFIKNAANLLESAASAVARKIRDGEPLL